MKKNNLELTVLKAIGIIAVVSCHSGRNIFDILSFPIAKNVYLFSEYSYHMPLFIFASGYFYKSIYEYNILNMIQKRFVSIKKYLKTNLFYFVLSYIFISTNMLNRDISFSLKSLFLEPFLGGFQYYFNGPGWFVPFLFLTQIVFTFLRKIISTKVSSFKVEDIKLEGVFLIFLMVVGCISTVISKNCIVINDNVTIKHCLLRIAFALQFYQIGYMYRIFLSDKVIFSLKSFLTLIAIKYIFIVTIGNYTFSLRTVKFDQAVFLPFIVSILGILYILHLSNFITRLYEKYKFKHLKYILFIGENTWAVMMHHLLIKWSLKKIYPILLTNAKHIVFMEYLLSPILSLVLPLIFAYLLNQVKEKKKLQEKVFALNATK